MDKRYQVFVSSTFADLKEERQAIVQAILSFDNFPAGMELFPATNDDQWTLIKSVINDSDYYVIVVGGRYGSTTPEGISYTEMEFDYAVEVNKPVLAFVHSKPEEIPAGKTDQSDSLRERLEAFRKKVMTGRVVRPWASTMELQAAVMQSLVAETKRNPQEGWIRAGQAADPAALQALKDENFALREQLQSLSVESPAGTDDLVQGDEDYSLRVYYRLEAFGTQKIHDAIMSWDNIFREVGPELLQEQTEKQMHDKLAREALIYVDKDGKSPRFASEARIYSDDFDNVKIQLFALGLIRKGSAKRAISDKNSYWALTPYGEAHLMRLRAIRKGSADGGKV